MAIEIAFAIGKDFYISIEINIEIEIAIGLMTLSIAVGSQILRELKVDSKKLERNLKKIGVADRGYAPAILSVIAQKKKEGKLPYKKDLKDELSVSHGVITGIVKSYQTAEIIKENRVGTYYQYDVHEAILLTESLNIERESSRTGREEPL